MASILAELDRQRDQVETRLLTYRAIESTHYNPAPGKREPASQNLMLYIALRRGILAAESYLRWLTETLAMLGNHRET